MIQSVRCYPLDSTVPGVVQSFHLPFGATFLSVKENHDELCLYVLEDEETELREYRDVRLFYTAQDIKHGNLKFLDTVVLNAPIAGAPVVHVFEQMS